MSGHPVIGHRSTESIDYLKGAIEKVKKKYCQGGAALSFDCVGHNLEAG
jgi:hypothetical protein